MADIWKEDVHAVVTIEASDNGALAETLSHPKPFELVDVILHVGVAAATDENFTITLDSNAGAAFDTNIVTQAMAGITDLVVTGINMKCTSGDKIVFAWANTDARTWGLTYRYRRMA